MIHDNYGINEKGHLTVGGAAPVIPFSALKGTGKDDVWRQIYNVIK